jgi:glycerol transport system permease protein
MPSGASLFSGLVLLIEIPLGILIALAMPKKGWGVSASLVTLAMPLLIPWNVIGTIWIIFTRPDIGLVRRGDQQPGSSRRALRPYGPAGYAWITLMAMEVWHWTPLVALLAMPGCAPSRRPITRPPKSTAPRLGHLSLHPAAQDARCAHHRRSAALDGQLSDLCRTLCPDRRRAGQLDHLSVHLSGQSLATGQFDLGPAAAFSLIYFLIVLLFSFHLLPGAPERRQRREDIMKIRKRTIALCILFRLLVVPIYWMLNMSLRSNADILSTIFPLPVRHHL